MTYNDWLRDAEHKLIISEVGTARLDALILLEHVSEKDRAYILAHPEAHLNPKALKRLDKLLTRRSHHEPISYIRGFSEFYGRNFLITHAVLEPRPESETMIEMLKTLVSDTNSGLKPQESLSIADVGTGSGAIGISAQMLLPKAHFELLDIDEKALAVARRNVDLFTLNISVIKSDLLTYSSPDLDILLCNLPYIPNNYHINEAALREPKIAIFGGLDGLDLYRNLFKQVDRRPLKPLYIFTESLPPQHDNLNNIAESSDYEKVKEDDFIVVFRCSSQSK